MRKLLLALPFAFLFCHGAHAQTAQAAVVSGCGTPPATYTAGYPYALTQDTTGKLCTSGSGGGGGAVTIASGGVASGAYSSGSIATGAYASGAVSTGGIVDLGTYTSPTTGTANDSLQKLTAAAQLTLTPVVSTSAKSSHVLKNAAGTLYSLYVTPTSAGLLMVFNATSAPGDGAVTPIECVDVAANTTTGITFAGIPPEAFSTGITAVFSSGTNCFSKTASAVAFFKALVQ